MDELSQTRCLSLLKDEQVAHLGVIDRGVPYVTPLSYVMLDGRLVFRTGPGRRMDAIRRNPMVCVEVSRMLDGPGWESVVLWGEAEEMTDNDRIEAAIKALLAKYHDARNLLGMGRPKILPRDNPVVAITITEITGRSSGGGFRPRTRPGRL